MINGIRPPLASMWDARAASGLAPVDAEASSVLLEDSLEEEVGDLRRREGSKTKRARSCAERPTSLGSIDLWRCKPEGR